MRVNPERSESFEAELHPVSLCPAHGEVPHRLGSEGSLSCVPCEREPLVPWRVKW
jgi:hypothetical protein